MPISTTACMQFSTKSTCNVTVILTSCQRVRGNFIPFLCFFNFHFLSLSYRLQLSRSFSEATENHVNIFIDDYQSQTPYKWYRKGRQEPHKQQLSNTATTQYTGMQCAQPVNTVPCLPARVVETCQPICIFTPKYPGRFTHS